MEAIKDLSSFVIQPFRRKFLKAYCDRMSKDNLNCLWDDNVASVLEEQGFSILEAPRSVYRVEKLYQALAKYAPKSSPKIDMDDRDVKVGVSLAYACFAKPKEDPCLELSDLTPDFIYKITSNHKGSAGLTAWGQTKAESYVHAYECALRQISGEKRPDPCVAFKRTQFNDKTRLVWGYPYAMTALEGLFARPLIERLKQGDTPMAFGMSTGVLGSKLRVAGRHKEWAYSTDVSSFDSSIGQQLIKCAFNILSTWFNLNEIETTSGQSYKIIWKMIVNYFIHTPIVMPDGNIYKGKQHGVPSGSYFTQIIDSVVNVILVGAISSRFSLHVDKSDIFVLGDDILFWSNRNVNLEHVAKYASSVFAMTFNAEKSSKYRYNEQIHYLGRDWMNGVPTLADSEILKRMVQPETFRKYDDDKVKRERQVRMLILSYVAVYRNAYHIYLKCMDWPRRYCCTNADIENWVYTTGVTRRRDRSYRPNADYMSGLARYLHKYVLNEHGSLGTFTPIALQFWK
uniref:RNA-dependent RNA polymerase n=1 Tax=Benes partiti-like virus TaxID=2716655 RepID=A0A6G7PS71_9VIRU|nr:RNA-dependent RNA polymerase [Benes partiti-like virus]